MKGGKSFLRQCESDIVKAIAENGLPESLSVSDAMRCVARLAKVVAEAEMARRGKPRK